MSPETEKLLREALLPHEFAEIQSLHQMYRDDSFWLGGTAALVLVSCVERLATALRAAEARAEANAKDAERFHAVTTRVAREIKHMGTEHTQFRITMLGCWWTLDELADHLLSVDAQEVDRG